VFERYNDQARRVIVLAQEEAYVLKHHYVGTEHLLLALTRDQTAPCTATRILSSLNVRRESILDLVRTDADAIEGDWHIPFTPLAKQALDIAWREASVLGGDYPGGNQISAEHLLLALATQDDGVAARALSAPSKTEFRELIVGAIIDSPPAPAPLQLTGD
jgi:ATP-dependent Clp protease ATP-binding subunit ClpC